MYRRCRDFKLNRKIAWPTAIGILSAYFYDLFFGKFCLAIIHAFSVIKSFALGAVSHIFELRSDIQVFWVETSSIIAFMQNHFLRIYIKSKINFSAYTVNKFKLMVYAGSSISKSMKISSPIPTTVFIDSFIVFETLFNWPDKFKHSPYISTGARICQ